MDTLPLFFNGKKTITTALRLVLIALFCPIFVSAMHIIGGEMTYRYISTNPTTGAKTFEFTLVVYRDCAGGGAQLDQDAPIGIYQGTSAAATLVDDFSVPLGVFEQVIPFIPPCTDPNATNGACAERGVYTFTRELAPALMESYFIVYQRCCRTSSIFNIDAPNTHGATYVAEISPLAFAGNNNSPVFKNYPPTFICAGFNIAFDHQAIDADGDSLVYVFCNPLDGGGNSGGGGGGGCNSPTPNPPCGPPFDLVPFTGGYTFEVPMGGLPLIAIDSATGFLDGVPDVLGNFVVGICVLEYRNGVLIGSTLRDFQFKVVDCTPTVFADILEDSLPTPGHFFVMRCGQNPVKIVNQSPPTPDLQTYLWEFDLQNGTTFSATTANVTVPLPNFGVFQGQLFLNRGLNCPDSALVTIMAYPGANADFSYDYDSCALTPVVFSDSSSSVSGLTNWNWTFYDPNTTSTVQNPTYDYKNIPGDYLTRLIVRDADGCRDTSSQTVLWRPKPAPPIPALVPFKLCLPEKAIFNNLFDPVTSAGMAFTWDFGDGSFSPLSGPIHTYTPGKYDVSVFIKTEYGCTATDTFPGLVDVYPGVTAAFLYEYDSCVFTPVEFTDLSTTNTPGGITNWDWTFFDPNTASTQQNPIYNFKDIIGDYDAQLIVTDADNCRDTAQQQVLWRPKPPPLIPNLSSLRFCLPEKAVFDTIFNTAAAADLDFTWDFGDGTTSSAPIAIHSYALPGIYDVSVLIKTDYGCISTDTFPGLVEAWPKPTAAFDFSPRTGISNLNPKVQFTNKSDPGVVLWNYDFSGLGGSNAPDPLFEWPDTGKMQVQLIVTNSDGCLDTTVQRLDVVPMIRLYFPNIFNPEKSLGVNNDRFQIIGSLIGYSDYELTIWSRWGELLFQSDDPNEAWDGRRRGSSKLQNPGVYTWYLHLKGPRGEPYEFTGTVTLVE